MELSFIANTWFHVEPLKTESQWEDDGFLCLCSGMTAVSTYTMYEHIVIYKSFAKPWQKIVILYVLYNLNCNITIYDVFSLLYNTIYIFFCEVVDGCEILHYQMVETHGMFTTYQLVIWISQASTVSPPRTGPIFASPRCVGAHGGAALHRRAGGLFRVARPRRRTKRFGVAGWSMIIGCPWVRNFDKRW